MKFLDLLQVLTSDEEYFVDVIDKNCNLIITVIITVMYDLKEGRKIFVYDYEYNENMKDCFELDLKKLLNAKVFRIGEKKSGERNSYVGITIQV